MPSLAYYHREVSLHLRSFSAAVLVLMLAVYAIAIFYAPEAMAWLRTIGPSSEVLVYNALSFTVLMIVTMTTKFGALWLLGPKPTNRRVLWQSFGAVSFYLVFAGSMAFATLLVARHLITFLGTRFWSESHWFWLSLILFLAFGFVAIVLLKYELYTPAVLQELRALPIVSPIFCFAGPKFLLDNFEKFGITSAALRPHAILLVVAGILFLLCLIVQAFSAHLAQQQQSPSKLIALDGSPLTTSRGPIVERRFTFTCFGLLGAALYTFALSLLDVTVRLFAGKGSVT
jgi:hypothetical protein